MSDFRSHALALRAKWTVARELSAVTARPASRAAAADAVDSGVER